jgi:phosphoglycolate phosphatase
MGRTSVEAIDLLIFDLDGTLVDSLDDIVESVNHTLGTLKLHPLPKVEIRGFVGDGIRNLLIRSLRTQIEPSEALIEKAGEIYWAHHDVHCLDHVILYPHVTDTLKFFAAKKKAVISNKSEHFTNKILRALNVSAYFDVILGGDSLPKKKPDPMPVHHVLEFTKVGRARAVIIGDGPQDMACGRAAGIRTCGVTYGFRTKEELGAADFVVGDLMELKNIFD